VSYNFSTGPTLSWPGAYDISRTRCREPEASCMTVGFDTLLDRISAGATVTNGAMGVFTVPAVQY
jgi:hypothetical protein